MQLGERQVAEMGRGNFEKSLDSGLCRHDATWAAQPAAQRLALLREYGAQARALGLVTARGVAAYALGASWLGAGFERRCSLLQAFLVLPMPESRKVHGLGEWVHDQLGRGATAASGEAALRRSFALTEPWGRHA